MRAWQILKWSSTALATVGVIAAMMFTLDWRGGGEGFPKLDAGDRALVSRGKAVYASHCAACHGTNLEGQPDWRNRRPNGRLPAPPHDATGHTWHHPDQVLFSITKDGLVPGVTAPAGYESDMPAFKSILSDADIAAVLAYIKSTWPAGLRGAQQAATSEASAPARPYILPPARRNKSGRAQAVLRSARRLLQRALRQERCRQMATRIRKADKPRLTAL